MYINKEHFDAWMERITDRFDKQDKILKEMKEQNQNNFIDGERLLDNQELAFLLKVSFRTLQRYRSERKIPYIISGKKTYYKLSDIHNLIRNIDENDKSP